jgi:uncharacterized protein YdeI (YjbR/CyaY-like superfamily)
MNPKVADYLSQATRWPDELAKLREIVLDCGLTEDFKWHQPCYTVENGIVLLISSFKDYCALAFFKGALLKDASAILTAPGANSQSMRQARFTSVRDIVAMEPILKSYIQEAIDNERAGLKIKKDPAASIPEEFQARLNEMPALKVAFDALTPGRRRVYLMHFSQPKQAKTREARIEKSLPQILAGKGLDDSRSTRKPD